MQSLPPLMDLELRALGVLPKRDKLPQPKPATGPVWDGKGECPF